MDKKNREGISPPGSLFSMILFFAVFAAVLFTFRIRQNKYMIQLLLDGSDAARILAADHIGDFFRKLQRHFIYNFFILNDVYRNIVIDETKDVRSIISSGHSILMMSFFPILCFLRS